jgi:hypothetical protein
MEEKIMSPPKNQHGKIENWKGETEYLESTHSSLTESSPNRGAIENRLRELGSDAVQSDEEADEQGQNFVKAIWDAFF